jgi:hypothetical protein
MTIDLSTSGAKAIEVKEVIASELLRRGFVDIGDSGRDKIDGQKTSFNFEGPNDLLVFVEVDRLAEVPIRVSQNRANFSPEAQELFNALASVIETRWPNSVKREPLPTK